MILVDACNDGLVGVRRRCVDGRGDNDGKDGEIEGPHDKSVASEDAMKGLNGAHALLLRLCLDIDGPVSFRLVV